MVELQNMTFQPVMFEKLFNTLRFLFCRRQYTESWNRIVELRAQIQAQLRLADTLKKISETAGFQSVRIIDDDLY